MEEEEKESAYTGENESVPLTSAVAKGRGGHLGVSLAADTPRFASVVRASWDSGSGRMVLSVDSVSSMTAASPSLPPSQSPSPPLNQRSREGQSRYPSSQPLSQPLNQKSHIKEVREAEVLVDSVLAQAIAES